MARTLLQILTAANAYTDLDASQPTGDELSTRTNYADSAVREAADIVQLPEFHEIVERNLGSSASTSLPINYRELMTSPKQPNSDDWDEFPEIRPVDRFSKENTDKYCYVTGNPMEGYVITFNNLEANVTLSIDYQRYPNGFATLTDICELPDDSYVTEKVKSYVLQARTDERFPQIEASAQMKLKNMIGRKSKPPGGGPNYTPRNTRGLGV